MNKIHRTVWNASTGTWTAVAETAKAHGKSASSGIFRLFARLTLRPLVQALAVVGFATLPYGIAQAQAPIAPTATQLPTGGQVVAGQAAISQSGAVMNINQSSNRAAIDWQTYNLGSAASINYHQPSASSVTLNRVLDANPSQIFGRINANGQVFLSNPSGITFAPGASVNVGGLVATTHKISVEDFMAGNTRFERDGATGSVINQGELQAALGGYIALLAPEVRNEGVIVANMGTVALAAGEAFELQFDSNNTLASLRVTPANLNTLVENKTAVLAPGGLVILSARAVDTLQGSVVNNGDITASSMVNKGGRIVLEGDDITLKAGSKIEATGNTGGGTVLVGGDWQGSGDMHQATTVTMEAGASIDASATDQGNGGKVVLWSAVHNPDSVTRVHGSITAKGGVNGGDGGQIETSGHALAIDGVSVNASAPNGNNGLWLLDPTDSTVTQAVADTYETTLNTGTDVTNLVNGDITFASNVVLSAAIAGDGEATLTFNGDRIQAANGSTIEATSGKLNVVFIANNNSADGADGVELGTINTNGGGLWVGAGTASSWVPYTGAAPIQVGSWNASGGTGSNLLAINVLGNITTNGGNVTFIAETGTGGSTDIASTGGHYTINAGSGDITLLQSNLNYDYYANTSLTVQTTGTLTIAPANGQFFHSGYVAGGSGNTSLADAVTWNGSLSSGTFTGADSIAGLKINNFANLGGLTIGKSTSTTNSNVTLSSAISIAGPITVYGGDITVNASLNTTAGGANGNVLLKASNSITQGSSVAVTTTNGKVTYWADSDASGAGYVQVANAASITTSGGNIELAGGLDDGSNGGTASDGTPDGYAVGYLASGIYYFGVGVGKDLSTSSTVEGASLNSGGGNILIRGKTGHTTSGVGVVNGSTINSGAGTVTIVGDGNTNGHGIELGVMAGTGDTTTTIQSSGGDASHAAITLTGSTSLSGRIGILSGYDYNAAGGVRILSTGTGGISITGSSSNAGANGSIAFNATSVLAASGPISIDAGSKTFNIAGVSDGTNGASTAVYLGYQASTEVTSSSSNITITADAITNAAAGLTAQSTGSLTVQPSSNDFSSALTLGSTWSLASGLTGLTIGKSATGADGTSDAAVTIDSTTSIAGPITVYGGDITVNQNLTSTATGADVLLKGSGNITLAASKAITTNGGDITLWSNSDGETTNGGYIYLPNGVTLDSRTSTDRTAGNTSTASGGGSITLGGGSAGTTAPTGSALYASASPVMGAVQLGTSTSTAQNAAITIVSGGGDIALRGKATASASVGDSAGILGWEGISVNAGAGGAITITGETTASGSFNDGINLGAFAGGAVSPASSLWQTHNGNITISGTASGGSGAQRGTLLYAKSATTPNTFAITGSGALNLTGSGSTYNFALSAVNLLAASGNISLTGTGTGSLFTGGQGLNTLGYLSGSAVTSSTSDITVENNSFSLTSGYGLALNSTGAVTIRPYGNDFSSAWTTTDIAVSADATGLTIGKSATSANGTSDVAVTIDSATSIAGPISVYGGSIAINAGLTATGSNTISLKGSGTVTDGASGYVSAANLALLGGAVTLDHASNAIGTLAASGVSALTYTDSNALTLGTVGSTNGISASGAVSVATLTGDLTVSQNVTTTDTTSSALALNAGKSAAAGTATGGNLVLSGSPSFSVGSNGTAKLYTGSVSGSTGVTTLVGSGSGKFRYNSDESTSNYTTALGSSGTYAIYREQPTANISSMTLSMTYGDDLPSITATGAVNGDGSNYTITSAVYSTASKLKVSGSPYTITSGLIGLGYAVTGVSTGTLTVGAKALNVSGLTAANKVYDGGTSATLSGTEALTNGGATSSDGKYLTVDTVSLTGTESGTFADKNVANGKTVTITGLSLSGTDAGNYTLNATTTANITAKTVSLSASKTYDGTTDLSGAVTITTGVGSETLTYSGATASSKDVATANKYINAITLADGSNGGVASNYQLPSLSAAGASNAVTITAKALTIIDPARLSLNL